ncbi:acyltransferase family protein [Hymenobacter sublimis]|uniref:Acyltransferase n=1 Tax=Hymenobacter sublimis TaxID=2933777 RepID=A0ABY4JDW0_9BACT|nr:acyltransferase [Hymenobacter sublimis]UPL50119.1 acyltransferase [Hymenobacter sublimis]
MADPAAGTALSHSSKTYLPAFTGVRALAAYLVFLHHFNPFHDDPEWPRLHAWILEFHVGVPIFFVLSSFLITLRYGQQDLTKLGGWAQYMRRRLARIYPLYFLLTLATYYAFWRAQHFLPHHFFFSLTLTQAFFSDAKYAGIAQAWSLTVEESFYLAAPLAFWLLRRRVPLWVQPFALLALGCGLVLVLSPITNQLYGFFGSFRLMLLFSFFGRCFEFYAGMQLARWYQQGRLRRHHVPGLLTLVGSAVMIAAVSGMVWTKGGYTYGQEHAFGVALNNVALPGGIIIFFAGLLTERTWLQRLLSTQLFKVLGKSSYAFYLIHLGSVRDWLALHLTPHNGILFIGLNLLAIVLHYAVEEPLNRFFRPAPIVAPGR